MPSSSRKPTGGAPNTTTEQDNSGRPTSTKIMKQSRDHPHNHLHHHHHPSSNHHHSRTRAGAGGTALRIRADSTGSVRGAFAQKLSAVPHATAAAAAPSASSAGAAGRKKKKKSNTGAAPALPPSTAPNDNSNNNSNYYYYHVPHQNQQRPPSMADLADLALQSISTDKEDDEAVWKATNEEQAPAQHQLKQLASLPHKVVDRLNAVGSGLLLPVATIRNDSDELDSDLVFGNNNNNHNRDHNRRVAKGSKADHNNNNNNQNQPDNSARDSLRYSDASAMVPRLPEYGTSLSGQPQQLQQSGSDLGRDSSTSLFGAAVMDSLPSDAHLASSSLYPLHPSSSSSSPVDTKNTNMTTPTTSTTTAGSSMDQPSRRSQPPLLPGMLSAPPLLQHQAQLASSNHHNSSTNHSNHTNNYHWNPGSTTMDPRDQIAWFSSMALQPQQQPSPQSHPPLLPRLPPVSYDSTGRTVVPPPPLAPPAPELHQAEWDPYQNNLNQNKQHHHHHHVSSDDGEADDEHDNWSDDSVDVQRGNADDDDDDDEKSTDSEQWTCHARLLHLLNPTPWLLRGVHVDESGKEYFDYRQGWTLAGFVRHYFYNPISPEFTSLQQFCWAIVIGIVMGFYTAGWKAFIHGSLDFLWVSVPSKLHHDGYFTDLNGSFPIYHYMWICPTICGGLLSYINQSLPVKIPDQNDWINNVHRRGVSDYRTFMSLFLLSTAGMASGLSLGPELPLVLTAGMAGSWLGLICKQSMLQARVMNLTAASAAVGGFFGFPMAGALFVLGRYQCQKKTATST